MRILITGANGYLGQGIVKAVVDKGFEVVATDYTSTNIDPRAKVITADLFEIDNPYYFFDKPDVLLHLAWRNGFEHYADTHIGDLANHYAFISKMAGAGVKHIAVMGSMHEVGFFEGSINENTPCHPITPYGISKNALRDLCQMICKKNSIVFQWIRGFYIVGNKENGSSIFSKIAMAVAAGEKEFPFTMGQNQYDFIDYNELCIQIATIIGQQNVQGIINACSGRPEKLADRVERFIDENGYDIKLKYGTFPDRPYDSKAVWGDNTKIEKIMNNR